jgi:hypothetical protein
LIRAVVDLAAPQAETKFFGAHNYAIDMRGLSAISAHIPLRW